MVFHLGSKWWPKEVLVARKFKVDCQGFVVVNFKIQGYDTIQNDRSTGSGGDVAFLVKHSLVVSKEFRNADFNIITNNEALAIIKESKSHQRVKESSKSDGWPSDFMHQCRTCVETLLACDWLFVSSF